MESRDDLLESIINAALALPSTQQIQFLEEACSDTRLRAEARSTLLALLEKSKESQTRGGTPDVPYRRTVHDRTGQTFGSYRVLKQLGSGGMGEVYLAHDSTLGRSVALKFVPQNRSRDDQTMKRFIQEARTASALNHPNILTVYEVGEKDGERYLATEYVDGGTLRTQIRDQGVTLGEALDIATQVASALVASHHAGIIHRDLKPTNIMLRKDGYVKVIDFGLAKLTDVARENSSFQDGEPPTTPGSLLGTVGYMSPEQARGEEVDARTDLWSLGVILFEMIAGHRPFEGETDSHVMVAIMERPTPGLPAAPPALEHVLQCALQKDRNKRYQDAAEMLADLRDIRQGMDVSLSSRRIAELHNKHKHSISWKLILALALTLLIPLLGLVIWGPHLFPSPERFEIGSIRQVTFNGHVMQTALSPNGELLASSVGDPGVDEAVLLRHLAGQADEEITVLPPSAVDVSGMTFSQDNRFLYIVTKGGGKDLGKLYRLPVAKPMANPGPPEEILEDVDGPISFSPDGRQFAYVRFAQQESSYRYELAVSETARPRSTTVLATKVGDEQLGKRVAWSGTGDFIATILYTTAADGVQQGTIDLIPVKPGKQERIVPLKGWESIGQLAWLNDEHDLVAVMSALGETFDQLRLRSVFIPTGKTELLAGAGLLDGAPGYRSVSISRDYRKLATVRQDKNARVWMSKPGVFGEGEYSSLDAQPAGDVAWSQDEQIVYSSSRQGHRDLWLLDPKTKNVTPITNAPYSDRSPVWVPGQNSVVFSSNRTGSYNIWRYDLNTSHYEQLTRGEFDEDPDVSPDGSSVVYTKLKGAMYSEVWQVPVKGGASVPLNVGQARNPRFSPDGTKLLCMTREEPPVAKWHNVIFSLAQGRILRTLDSIPAGLRAQWMPDGREVAFTRVQANVSNVVAYSLDHDRMRPVTHFEDGQIDAMNWTANGRRLALIRANRSSDAFLVVRRASR